MKNQNRVFAVLVGSVEKWAKERNMYCPENGATPDSQYLKFLSELGELSTAILDKDKELIKDAIGDCMVCLINKLALENHTYNFSMYEGDNIYVDSIFSHSEIQLIDEAVSSAYNSSHLSISTLMSIEDKIGFEYLECLEHAYNEIKDRKGKMINRNFVKESDLYKFEKQ